MAEGWQFSADRLRMYGVTAFFSGTLSSGLRCFDKVERQSDEGKVEAGNGKELRRLTN